MIRVYAWLGFAALVGTVGLAGWLWVSNLRQEREEALQKLELVTTQLDTAKIALAASSKNAATERRVLTSRVNIEAELRAKAEARNKELYAAIKSNPEWAGSPVPDGVWDAIGSTTGADSGAENTPSVDDGLPSP